jgi:hypothetical protein
VQEQQRRKAWTLRTNPSMDVKIERAHGSVSLSWMPSSGGISGS